MINKTSSVSPSTKQKQNISFGYNLKEAQKVITKRLINTAAKTDHLERLGKKVQTELADWNIFAHAKPLGTSFDSPESKHLWENRFVAHEFIGGHLNSIDNTARSFLSNTCIAKQNVKDLNDWGITVRKNSDEVKVDYSEDFVNNYLSACAEVVDNNIPLNMFVDYFGHFVKKNK